MDRVHRSITLAVQRAAANSANWSSGSLSDTVEKIAGPNAQVSYTDSGKTIYTNPVNGLSVVYDNTGNYYRVTNSAGQYVDQNGNPLPNNVPLVGPNKTTQTGVPSGIRPTLIRRNRGIPMQMKASKFIGTPSDYQASEEIEFQLTGELSEWLFATRFWQNFNATHDTIFDQFEEDEVTIELVKQVAASIFARIRDLRTVDQPSVEFVYRRLPDGMPVTAQIAKDGLIEEMTRLGEFLTLIAERYAKATFDL
ncbi:hypothetical protein G3N95_00130 [Paraburkholderia sp. Tr-20389]|uniref:hypothetical protein n=1 Tax=Paraburkholderia sp. Tr-20389 TaxID=2703903 RepID=UPI0019819DD1|nr:hypothetical protein [Paraburkholderia sp. Tr-20389]MBN3751330.1 hypothetical protein [Paraburkholderia sp. Tr-20389]